MAVLARGRSGFRPVRLLRILIPIVILAGFGIYHFAGSSVNNYRGDLNNVENKFAPPIQALQTKINAENDANLVATDATSEAALVSQYVTALRAVKGGSGVAQAAATTVFGAYDAFAADLRTLAADAKNHNTTAYNAETTVLNSQLTAVNSAIDTLNAIK
jgi:hypothetical protein